MLQWLDKSSMDYTNLGDQMPYEFSFGAIRTADGQWSSENQRYNKPYICKTPKGQSITTYNIVWKLINQIKNILSSKN